MTNDMNNENEDFSFEKKESPSTTSNPGEQEYQSQEGYRSNYHRDDYRANPRRRTSYNRNTAPSRERGEYDYEARSPRRYYRNNYNDDREDNRDRAYSSPFRERGEYDQQPSRDYRPAPVSEVEQSEMTEREPGSTPQRQRRRMRISESNTSRPNTSRSDDTYSNRYTRDGGGYPRRGRYDSNRPYDRPTRGYGDDRYGYRGYDPAKSDDDHREDGYNPNTSAHYRERREQYKDRYNTAREYNRRYYQQGDDAPANRYDSNPGPYGNSDRYEESDRYNRPQRPYRPRTSYGPNHQGRGGYDNRRPQQRRGGAPAPRKFVPRPKQIIYNDDHIDADAPIRLNKYLANTGACSRREADEMISAGRVSVNGEVITELGSKIIYSDSVMVDGKEVKPENKVYVLLNKPRNCVTTSDDPQERMTVLDLVKTACRERIYPVGRLDRNTTGVLLLTNDGDLASRLVHPSFKKKKIYHVCLDKEVTVEDMQQIADGVELDDGEMHADAISYASDEDHTQVGIEIHSGRNRIVRRLFEHLGYHVRKLDRVYFAGLTKKNVSRGKWRFLTQEEVDMLRMGAFE